jgi:tetratricopeptide (TPR) repeat protein
MKYLFFAIFIVFPLTVNAQTENQYIRQGNREYNKGEYVEAEVSYRKANEKRNNRLSEILFNIGDALYKQEKYDEAAEKFTSNMSMNEDKTKRAAGLYNLGNSYLKSGKLNESIEAYKASLKLQPNNFEAKYNLAYAQDLLKEQEQQEQNQQQDQQNQDNNNQDNQQDQNQQSQDNQDQDKQQQQEQNQQEQQISREDAERLLNALANDEKKTLEWMRLIQAAGERRNAVKNW